MGKHCGDNLTTRAPDMVNREKVNHQASGGQAGGGEGCILKTHSPPLPGPKGPKGPAFKVTRLKGWTPPSQTGKLSIASARREVGREAVPRSLARKKTRVEGGEERTGKGGGLAEHLAVR